MQALDLLKRFVEADHEPGEVRAYTAAHGTELAAAFGVTEEAFTKACDDVGDEETLASRILGSIKVRLAKLRDTRAAERSATAQIAADQIAGFAHWENDRALLDVPALLATALTTRGTDLLVFRGEGFEVAIFNAPLLALRSIKRCPLTGWVDAKALHIRWATGGLTLLPKSAEVMAEAMKRETPRVTLNLPPMTQTTAPVKAAPVVELPPVPVKKAPMKKSIDSLITQFQNACLEKLAAVEAAACTEITALESERDALRESNARAIASEAITLAKLDERDAWIRDLQKAGATAAVTDAQADEISRLTLQLSERDSRIGNLLKLLTPENDSPEEDQSATIDRLTAELDLVRHELATAEEALKEAEEEVESSEKEATEAQSELEALMGKIPGSEALASVVHDFLRSDRLLPANLDVPLSITPHLYRDGLSRAVGSELP